MIINHYLYVAKSLPCESCSYSIFASKWLTPHSNLHVVVYLMWCLCHYCCDSTNIYNSYLYDNTYWKNKKFSNCSQNIMATEIYDKIDNSPFIIFFVIYPTVALFQKYFSWNILLIGIRIIRLILPITWHLTFLFSWHGHASWHDMCYFLVDMYPFTGFD